MTTSVSAAFYKVSNKAITVGIDTQYGSSISWLSDNNNPTRNLVNCHDEGREIQQSYYAGPQGYHGCVWNGQQWPWNPISAGDAFGNKGTVLAVNQTADVLSIKSIPLQWACNNVPCECTFETTITFPDREQALFVVRNTLVMRRTDKTDYGARSQESPAVYTIGAFSDLWSSRLGQLTQLTYPAPGPGFPWGSYSGLDSWMAAAMPASENAQRYSVGVFNPNTISFLGGFYGTPSPQAGSHDEATMYMSPILNEDLLWNSTRRWCYAISIGYLDNVFSTFQQLRRTGLQC